MTREHAQRPDVRHLRCRAWLYRLLTEQRDLGWTLARCVLINKVIVMSEAIEQLRKN
jgi:hypothetical protein